MFIEIMQVIGPVWAAFLFGIVMGWLWRPTWLFCLGTKCTFDLSEPPPPSSTSVIGIDGSSSTQDSNFKDAVAAAADNSLARFALYYLPHPSLLCSADHVSYLQY